MNIGIIIPTNTPTKFAKQVKISPGHSEIFGVIYDDFCRVAAKGAIVNSVNSHISGPNVTKIVHNVEKLF